MSVFAWILMGLFGPSLLFLAWLALREWSGSNYDQGVDDGKMMAEMLAALPQEEKDALVAEAMGRHPAGKSPARGLQPCRFYDPPGLWCAPCRSSDFANCTDRR